jgi:hypothetical protein
MVALLLLVLSQQPATSLRKIKACRSAAGFLVAVAGLHHHSHGT